MAATALVQGVQREIWREAANQGPGLQTIVTGIRISTAKLGSVQGILTIDEAVGAPVITAVPGVGATGLLEVAVTNLTGGTTANWTLDVRLVQSTSQANDAGAVGYIQVASGVTGGLAGSQTLAATYDVGTLVAHQTMTIDDVGHGGGVIFDASTAAATVANPAVDVRQNSAVSTPFMASKRGDDAVGALMVLQRGRGTYGAPGNLVDNDVVGDIDFVGRIGGAFVNCARIECPTPVAGEGFYAPLDFYAANAADVDVVRLWSMINGGAGINNLIGYGTTINVIPNTNNIGSLGISTNIWHEINASQENLYHASADAVSSYLHFYKSRGTLAAPADADLADALGTISFFGYRTGMIEGAKIVGAASGVGVGTLGGAIDFYTKATSTALARAVRINTTTTPTNQVIVTDPGQVVPDVWPNTSGIGDPNIPWNVGHFTNLVAARAAAPTPAGGALGTVLFANNSAMPVPQADQVYVGSVDFTGGTTLAALAVSAEEPAVVVGAAAIDYLVPIMYNGEGFYLHATRIVI